jgi:hypothetical protein
MQSRPDTANLLSARGAAAISRPSQLSVAVLLPQTAVDQLHERAAAKGMSATAFASKLLEIITRDGLYEAILDGLETSDRSAGPRDLG